MRGVIVARRSRVFDLTVIGHTISPNVRTRCGGLSVIVCPGQRDGAVASLFLPGCHDAARGALPCMFRGYGCGRSACRDGAESLLSKPTAIGHGQHPCSEKNRTSFLTQTGPGTPDGSAVPLLLAAGAARRGTAAGRVPAGAGQAPVRAPVGVPRFQRQIRPDRRILRPSRRVAVVRPQRGGRAALPLSRLEIRRERPVHGGALRAGRKRLLQEDQAHILPAGQARRGAVGLYGPARQEAAAAGMGIRHGAAGADLRLQAAAGIAIGCKPWKAASIRATSRSCIAATSAPIRCSRAPRAINTISPTCSRISKWSSSPAASSSARGAMPRAANITGASRRG